MTRSLAAALILVATMAASCGATGVTPLPTATIAVTSAPVTTPASLRGTWTSDVVGTTASSGKWMLLISDSNVALQNPVGGDPFTLDPTSMSETSIVFPAAADCPDQKSVTEGQYTIALTGDTLVFTLVNDSCGDRSATLTTAPWRRKS